MMIQEANLYVQQRFWRVLLDHHYHPSSAVLRLRRQQRRLPEQLWL
jgi:hypothetical protein